MILVNDKIFNLIILIVYVNDIIILSKNQYHAKKCNNQ